jgi:signal transduction histidine kinase
MQTRTEAVEPLELTTIRDDAPESRERRRPLGRVATVVLLLALVAGVSAIWAAALDSDAAIGPGRVLCAVLVVVWCTAAVYASAQRDHELLPVVMAVGAVAGAVAMLGAAYLGHPGISSGASDVAAAARALGVALLPVVALHLTLGLPDGVLGSTPRRVLATGGYVAAVGVAGVLYADLPDFPLLAVVVLAVLVASCGIVGFVIRGQRAALPDRPRFQWPAWGATVAVAIAVGAGILEALVGWPDQMVEVAAGATVLVPVSLALGARPAARPIDRLLVHTIVLAGLAGLVGVSYVLIVLGLGRTPTEDEQTLLGLSMVAAAAAALLWVPARERLAAFATQRVYGERHAPDEVLRTFGSRLTRALPLDELLLQLAESLQKTMSLESAEVWTHNVAGRLERTVSVPDRGAASITLAPEEEQVVARAGVSGPAWARVWLPNVLDGRDEPVLRVAPVTNSGKLLGVVVVRRPDGATAFGDDDDRALTELARQVGLALHNVELDSALQESIDEVRRHADELRASRVRVVEAGDAERRRIERDLHDGAQQHLVALAVSLRLARQVADADPEQAKLMLDQLGGDLQEAVQELRNLAHGIYPPLLAERGLPDALSAAAGRAALPTTIEADGIGRYPQGVEAAVYFCCLEALQNAGKHAGEGASAAIRLREEEHALLFEIADDGAGFDVGVAGGGHGFVNLRDRVGAFGGMITVDSAPGEGSRIAGRIPLPD